MRCTTSEKTNLNKWQIKSCDSEFEMNSEQIFKLQLEPHCHHATTSPPTTSQRPPMMTSMTVTTLDTISRTTTTITPTTFHNTGARDADVSRGPGTFFFLSLYFTNDYFAIWLCIQPPSWHLTATMTTTTTRGLEPQGAFFIYFFLTSLIIIYIDYT